MPGKLIEVAFADAQKASIANWQKNVAADMSFRQAREECSRDLIAAYLSHPAVREAAWEGAFGPGPEGDISDTPTAVLTAIGAHTQER